MKYFLLLTILPLLIPTVAAQEYMPHPTADISYEQWQAYYKEVSEKHSATERKHPDQKLATYSDPSQRLQFAFTMEGHPAHPSWITRQVVEEDGAISLSQIGYYAGSETEFAKLFDSYEQMNEKIRESMRK